jgi:hypothetical protein
VSIVPLKLSPAALSSLLNSDRLNEVEKEPRSGNLMSDAKIERVARAFRGCRRLACRNSGVIAMDFVVLVTAASD